MKTIAITGFHAHVYFRDADERSRALALRAEIGRRFREVTLGRVHDRRVGPHPVPMYQVAFSAEDVATFLPFLMVARDGLPVLVHPLTGDPLAEHTEQACWLGEVLPLRTEVFAAASSTPEASTRSAPSSTGQASIHSTDQASTNSTRSSTD
ncbi:MAG: DOPA 4,5-dioxygenase family protein [Myxococcota bacterium]